MRAGLAALFLAAAPAGAEPWSCLFTALCPAGQACADTALQARILAPSPAVAAIFASEDSERVLTRLGENARAYAAPDMLVTITQTGTATLTTHDRPARSYLGRCEEMR